MMPAYPYRNWDTIRKIFISNFTGNPATVFVISKIIGFLLDPFLWILLLVAAYFLVRDDVHKRRLRSAAIILFLFFSNSFIIDNIWAKYQWKAVQLNTTFQTGILLGGMAGYDESTNQGFFGSASDRFIQAARLYHTGQIKRILVTGGNAIFVKQKGYNEADFIAKNLEELKVPREHILLEKRARNTIQNAAFSKQILDSLGNSSSLIITSAIHMPRAMKVFEKAGMAVAAFPCNYRILQTDTEFTWKSLIPSQEAFNQWTLILKEWVGLIQLAN
jgi:uncharacterized SAM-binding protein YcdF (DUF218 family)